MPSVVLSILLVVLMSGAALWVVANDRDKPTSEEPGPASSPAPVVEARPEPPPPRRPATSRRRPPPVQVPAPLALPAVVAVQAPPPVATVHLVGAPIPRHRARSGMLLVLFAVAVGLLMAVVLGAIVTALAFALRAAVTS